MPVKTPRLFQMTKLRNDELRRQLSRLRLDALPLGRYFNNYLNNSNVIWAHCKNLKLKLY
jgi:hypothetical protein